MENQEMQIVKTSNEIGVMSLRQVTDRVNLVHEVLKKVMVEGTHYGKVPGCGNKMVLLKPGADVLAMVFKLVPQFQVIKNDLANGHREFDVTCSMYAADGSLLGQGVGSCSTMEKKYRYRKNEKGDQIENDNIADVYNTVLKMAKKRAHIDATLTVTGAADIFTQDLIEDEDEPRKQPVKMPTATKAKEQTTTVTGEVTNVSKAESKPDAAKHWVKWGLTIGESTYGTFDKELGEFSESLIGKTVTITYSENGKYKTIVTIDNVVTETSESA